MKINKTVLKLAGGLFAVGIAASSLVAGTPGASAKATCAAPGRFSRAQEPVSLADFGKPDLVVRQLCVERLTNQQVRFTVQIANQGNSVAPAGFWTTLSVDTLVETFWVEMAGLAPDATRSMSYDHFLPLTSASHLVGLRVDDNLSVNEMSELNNYQTLSFQ